MKNSTKIPLAIVIFAVLLAASSLLYNSLSEKTDTGEYDMLAVIDDDDFEAPDFTVEDGEGEYVTLSNMRGVPTVVNFWASWCPPCRSEMPHFEAMYGELGDRVNFMMVDLTGGGETKAAADEYIEKNGFTFPVYYDTDGGAGEAYEVRAIPMSIFIDAEGKVRAFTEGAMDLATLRRGINLAMGND
jgi:thiol-disulfide isomerase/thioredoxin